MPLKHFALFFVLSLSFFMLPVPAEAAQMVMKTERADYDVNIDSIELEIYNATGGEVSYGLDFSLQRTIGDQTVDVEPKRPVVVPELAAVLANGATGRETVRMDGYTPLEPGEYRLIKRIHGYEIPAGFTILDPKQCLNVKEPRSIAVTLQMNEKTGAFTVGPNESPAYVTRLWHELLTFKKGKMPEGGAKPFAAMTLDGQTSLEFYQINGRIWAETGGEWFYTADSLFAARLEGMGEALGAFLPASGEELIKALNTLPSLEKVRFSAHDFERPFALAGWRSDRETSGVTLSIFQFPSAEAVNQQMGYLYDDGYTLGIGTRAGSGSSQAVSFGRQRFDWSDPPHYFKAGSRVVLYNGGDEKVLAALSWLLGPEVEPRG